VSEMLEVADAGLVEDHAADGKFRGGGFARRAGGWRGGACWGGRF
jgi:hypothetical protein